MTIQGERMTTRRKQRFQMESTAMTITLHADDKVDHDIPWDDARFITDRTTGAMWIAGSRESGRLIVSTLNRLAEKASVKI